MFLGVDDKSVDMLTSTRALSFEAIWKKRNVAWCRGVRIPTISRSNHIMMLRAMGREEDLRDLYVAS